MSYNPSEPYIPFILEECEEEKNHLKLNEERTLELERMRNRLIKTRGI